jgi:hypothetical protein
VADYWKSCEKLVIARSRKGDVASSWRTIRLQRESASRTLLGRSDDDEEVMMMKKER